MASKTNSVADEKQLHEDLKEHKCLLYWHNVSLHSIPLGVDRRIAIFPGYNAFDFSDLKTIISECLGLINSGMITFWGIDVDGDGNFREYKTLDRVNINDLSKILGETYSSDTIGVLSNPDIVPAVYVNYAVERGVKLRDSVGTEADNVQVHEVRRGSL